MTPISLAVSQLDSVLHVRATFDSDAEDCRSIIHRHEDRLWAESNDGSVATFAFTIPSGSDRVSEAVPGDEDALNGYTF
jgi:light-regulated signal transduction histidine kinase (bacteriophytochrome)